MEIRNKELYKIKNGGEYQTFEAYCRGAWDFQHTYAYHLIASVEVVDDVSSIDDIQKPSNQSQTRPLEKLPTKKRCEAWKKAVETAPEGKVTAVHVSKVVKEMTAPPKNKRGVQSPLHGIGGYRDCSPVLHLPFSFGFKEKDFEHAFSSFLSQQKSSRQKNKSSNT